MEIRRSSLLAALARLATGPLAYTRDYSWSLLVASWRASGLRQDELKEVLRHCVSEGYLELHGDENEAQYRLTGAGELALDEWRWEPWRRWRGERTLDERRDGLSEPWPAGEPRRPCGDLPPGSRRH